MKFNILYLLFLFCSIFKGYSQTDSIIRYEKRDSIISQTYSCHLYLDINEALKAPLDVRCLDLRSKGLKEFPKVIFDFKNIEYLDLSAEDKSALYSEKLKAEKEREQYRKDHPNRIVDEVSFLLGSYNPNTIKNIPDEIKQLKKLKWIDLTHTDLTKHQIKHLRRLLPNCIVKSNYDEL